jgi:hypothetical protein
MRTEDELVETGTEVRPVDALTGSGKQYRLDQTAQVVGFGSGGCAARPVDAIW